MPLGPLLIDVVVSQLVDRHETLQTCIHVAIQAVVFEANYALAQGAFLYFLGRLQLRDFVLAEAVFTPIGSSSCFAEVLLLLHINFLDVVVILVDRYILAGLAFWRVSVAVWHLGINLSLFVSALLVSCALLEVYERIGIDLDLLLYHVVLNYNDVVAVVQIIEEFPELDRQNVEVLFVKQINVRVVVGVSVPLSVVQHFRFQAGVVYDAWLRTAAMNIVSPPAHPLDAANVVAVPAWLFKQQFCLVGLDMQVIFVIEFLEIFLGHMPGVDWLSRLNIFWLFEHEYCSLNLFYHFP